MESRNPPLIVGAHAPETKSSKMNTFEMKGVGGGIYCYIPKAHRPRGKNAVMTAARRSMIWPASFWGTCTLAARKEGLPWRITAFS
jgi:hypothetical protein